MPLPKTQRTALLTVTSITTHLHGQPGMRVEQRAIRERKREREPESGLECREDFEVHVQTNIRFAIQLVVSTKCKRKQTA